MKARQLIEGATHDPESLRVAFQAFDIAWDRIAPNYGDDQKTVEEARVKLAKIVLSIVNSENTDPARISSLALEMFACS